MKASTIDSSARTPNSDFSRLWFGENVSVIGTHVSLLVLLITTPVILLLYLPAWHNREFGRA